MADLTGWWGGLDSLTQWFFAGAVFFSVFFLWQVIAAFIGLGHGEDTDGSVDHAGETGAADHDAGHGDAYATVVAFKLLSIRSVLAFFMLFSWAGAMYLWRGLQLPMAMLYALIWGVGAMLAVAYLFHFMRRMTETGTGKLSSCVGAEGTVYLDIPAGGQGEARVSVSGVVSVVKARAAGGAAINSGTAVRVTRLVNQTTVEVEPVISAK